MIRIMADFRRKFNKKLIFYLSLEIVLYLSFISLNINFIYIFFLFIYLHQNIINFIRNLPLGFY